MKIQNKSSFIWGIVFLCPLPLFALGIIEGDWWQWAVSLALAVKFLHAGLSKAENARQQRIAAEYGNVSRQLFGKYAAVKTNLPWVIAGGFFAAALAIRLIFDIVIPVWAAVIFAVVLTISVCYSIGLDRAIVEQIDREMDEEQSE